MNRLTAEMYEEIVASLRSDRNGRLNEKRKKPRVGLRSSLEVVPCPELGEKARPPVIVWVRDVSADGLGLVSARSVPVEMKFVVEFERFERENLRVQYRVAYCKSITRGLYSIGARVVSVLSAHERVMISAARKSA